MTGTDVAAREIEDSLPQGWASASLEYLGVEVQTGFATGKHNRDGIGIIHMRPMNITPNGSADFSDVRYIEDVSDRRVQHGDVIFNNTNSPAWVGKTAWIDSDEPLAYSNHMTRLRPPSGLDGRFLAIQLHHLWAVGYFKSILNNHVNQASVSRKALLDTVVSVPPLAEQRRIVAKLDEQLAHVEAGEAAIRATAALRQTLKDALLDHHILGRGEDPDPHSVNKIAQQPSTKFSYQELPALPYGWQWHAAKDVCTLITSGSTPKAPLMHSGSGDIPFLKVYNISKEGQVDFSIRPTYINREVHERGLKKSRLLPGDVLTNIVGPPLGKSAVIPKSHAEWNINQAIAAFRASADILPKWLHLALLTPFVINLLTSTARATAGQFNIALSTCRELPIPVPPLHVQQKLCDYLEGELARLGQLDCEVGEISRMPTQLRAALLHAAFTGALVPQDPSDEPASALLARIRNGTTAPLRKTRAPRARTSKSAGDPGQGELPL